MEIEPVEIENALKYYQIEEEEYKNKCYECIEDIENIEELHTKVEEIYNILYKDETYQIDNFWKARNIEEIFGKDGNPFMTNLLVLLGYRMHENNMETKKYNDIQKSLYKQRVREALTNDIFVRKLEGIRISQMIWAVYFIRTRLIEVGRLQYEEKKGNINIHIPAGSKMEQEKVIASIKTSKIDIAKYFHIKNPKYYCNSWLLSNQLNAMIDTNSNIARFYSLFEVKDGEDATKDILNFVFQVENCDSYSTLREDTSLQRLLKHQLLANKKFKIGEGKLKLI